MLVPGGESGTRVQTLARGATVDNVQRTTRSCSEVDRFRVEMRHQVLVVGFATCESGSTLNSRFPHSSLRETGLSR